ncbi:hypothetical protein BJV74DRAFT_891469 [Russula compacta]|nr:hypothetical protein BJV74DRAFT_891469 [Russula compacta]
MSPSNNNSLLSDEQGLTYNSEESELDNSVHLMPSTQISPDMSKAELLKLLKTAQLQNLRINKQYRRLRIDYKALQQSFIDIEHSNIMHMELEQLLQNPMKPAEKYPLFPSLLYPSKDCTSPLLFEVEALAMFLRIILHGKSAIDSSGLGQHPNKALLWGIMETTPGMITLTPQL